MFVPSIPSRINKQTNKEACNLKNTQQEPDRRETPEIPAGSQHLTRS